MARANKLILKPDPKCFYKTDGVPSSCVVNLDDLTTIPKALLQRRLTVLSPEKMQQVDDAIRFALDLS